MQRIRLILGKLDKQHLFYALAFFTIALFLAEVVVLVLMRETWVDEVFSSFKGYLYLLHEIVPFQKGIFEYPPLVIPTYGLVQYFFGPSLYAGRIFSTIIFGLMLGILYRIVKCQTNPVAGCVAVLFVLSNLLLAGNYVSVTWYSLMGVFSLLLVAIEMGGFERSTKTILSALVVGVMILGRTNMVVVLITYVLFLLFMKVSYRQTAFFLSLTGFIVVIGYLPIILPNPALAFAHILSPFGNFGAFKSLPPSLKVGGNDLGRFLEVLTEFLKEYYGFLTAFSVVTLAVIVKEGKGIFKFLQKESGYFLALLLSLMLMAAHYFYWRIVGNVYYANYFIPLLVLVFMIGAEKFLLRDRGVTILLGTLLVLNFSFNAYRTDVISSPSDESDLHRVERGAKLLREFTKPEDTILVFDNSIYHVYLADRRTYLPLINRDFLFMANKDTSTVSGLGFYNIAMLKSWIENDVDFVAIHAERWPSSLLRRPFWGQGDEDIKEGTAEMQRLIEENFELAGTAINVYPRKYTDGNDGGTLLLYKRKTE